MIGKVINKMNRVDSWINDWASDRIVNRVVCPLRHEKGIRAICNYRKKDPACVRCADEAWKEKNEGI